MNEDRMVRYIKELREKSRSYEVLISKLINQVNNLESQLYTLLEDSK